MMPLRHPADRPSRSVARPFWHDIYMVHWTVVFCRPSPTEVALTEPGTCPVKLKEVNFALDLPPLGVGSRFGLEMADLGICKV